MNTTDLQAMGLTEMNETELREVDGGWIGAAVLFQLAMEVLDGSFFSDFSKGYNETRY